MTTVVLDGTKVCLYSALFQATFRTSIIVWYLILGSSVLSAQSLLLEDTYSACRRLI